MPSSRCAKPLAEEIISGRAPAFDWGASDALRGVPAKKLRDDAAMLPASVLRKNFLRVHFSIAVLWILTSRAQLTLATRQTTSREMGKGAACDARLYERHTKQLFALRATPA